MLFARLASRPTLCSTRRTVCTSSLASRVDPVSSQRGVSIWDCANDVFLQNVRSPPSRPVTRPRLEGESGPSKRRGRHDSRYDRKMFISRLRNLLSARIPSSLCVIDYALAPLMNQRAFLSRRTRDVMDIGRRATLRNLNSGTMMVDVSRDWHIERLGREFVLTTSKERRGDERTAMAARSFVVSS